MRHKRQSYSEYTRISKRRDSKKRREEIEGPPCGTVYDKVTSIEGEKGDPEKSRREGEGRRYP